MIHFICVVGNTPQMYFHTELFLKTLEFYSKIKFFFTLVVNKETDALDWTLKKDLELEKHLKSTYPTIAKYADILVTPACYKTRPTSFWKVKPKADICAIINNDLLVCGDLNPFLNDIDKDKFNGVISFDCPIDMKEWMNIFSAVNIEFDNKNTKHTNWSKKECPQYYNYGNIVMPAILVPIIEEKLTKNIKKITSLDCSKINKFIGQVGLAVTLEELKIPCKDLPVRYNFPDFTNMHEIKEEEFSQVKILHYMKRKDQVFDMNSITSRKSEDVYWDLINKVLKPL